MTDGHLFQDLIYSTQLHLAPPEDTGDGIQNKLVVARKDPLRPFESTRRQPQTILYDLQFGLPAI